MLRATGPRRLVKDFQKKYESQIPQDTRFNIIVLDRSAEDHFSTNLIPDHEGSKGMKALKITSDGNCLYNFASPVIQGHESANLVLRLLTAVDLYLNPTIMQTTSNLLAVKKH